MMARSWRSQKGMTLLEVLVTLGVMSVVFISTLEFYSSSYAFLRGQEAKSSALQDANRIMALLAEDIRGAEALMPDFASAPRTPCRRSRRRRPVPTRTGAWARRSRSIPPP